MNAGLQTIEWLYDEQLKVDTEWAVRKPGGFTWWPGSNAQTIEVAGEETAPDGETAQLISIQTDVLRDLECDEDALLTINAMLMPFASMSGPVYDSANKSLALRALVRVHSDNHEWMRPLLSVVAVTQLEEAAKFSDILAGFTGATAATSEHPDSGPRVERDELFDVVPGVLVPMGEQDSNWTDFEFESLAEEFFQRPPCLLGNVARTGAIVEFPYGDASSLCRMITDEPHPSYGNGLLMLQSFPFIAASEADGARTALLLNYSELSSNSSGYGMGSFVYRDNAMHFTSFMPNAVHQSGLLPNFYFACATRAQAASEFFMDSNWAEEPFEPRRSALGRIAAFFGRQSVSAP